MSRDKQGLPSGLCRCEHVKKYVSKDGLLCCYCGRPAAKYVDIFKPPPSALRSGYEMTKARDGTYNTETFVRQSLNESTSDGKRVSHNPKTVNEKRSSLVRKLLEDNNAHHVSRSFKIDHTLSNEHSRKSKITNKLISESQVHKSQMIGRDESSSKQPLKMYTIPKISIGHSNSSRQQHQGQPKIHNKSATEGGEKSPSKSNVGHSKYSRHISHESAQRVQPFDPQQYSKSPKTNSNTAQSGWRSTETNIQEGDHKSSTGIPQGITTPLSHRGALEEQHKDTTSSEIPHSKGMGSNVDMGIPQCDKVDCKGSRVRSSSSKDTGYIINDTSGSKKSKYDHDHNSEINGKLATQWPRDSHTNQRDPNIHSPKREGSDCKSDVHRNESRSLHNVIDKLHTNQRTRTVTECSAKLTDQHTRISKALSNKSTRLLSANHTSRDVVGFSNIQIDSKESLFRKDDKNVDLTGHSTKTSSRGGTGLMELSKKLDSTKKKSSLPFAPGHPSENHLPLTPCLSDSSNIEEVRHTERQRGHPSSHDYSDTSKGIGSKPGDLFDHVNESDHKSRVGARPSTCTANASDHTDDGHSSSQKASAIPTSSSGSPKYKVGVPGETAHKLAIIQTGQIVQDHVPTIPLPTSTKHNRGDGSIRDTPGQIPLLQIPIMTDYVDLTEVDLNRPSTQKRHAADTGLCKGESADKKRKTQEMGVSWLAPMQTVESVVKPCQLLFHGAMPYEEIYGYGPTIKGVYKIAYKAKAIYVGRDSCNVINQLREHFNGGGQRELFNFLTSLTPEARLDVTVYWLDANSFDHKCGQSYLKCVEYIQRQKPMFNGVHRKPLYQSHSSDSRNIFAQQAMDVNSACDLEKLVKDNQMTIANPMKAESLGTDVTTADGCRQGLNDKDLAYPWMSNILDTTAAKSLDPSTPKNKTRTRTMVIDLSGDDSSFSQRHSHTAQNHQKQKPDDINPRSIAFMKPCERMAQVQANNLKRVTKQTTNTTTTNFTLATTDGIVLGSPQMTNEVNYQYGTVTRTIDVERKADSIIRTDEEKGDIRDVAKVKRNEDLTRKYGRQRGTDMGGALCRENETAGINTPDRKEEENMHHEKVNEDEEISKDKEMNVDEEIREDEERKGDQKKGEETNQDEEEMDDGEIGKRDGIVEGDEISEEDSEVSEVDVSEDEISEVEVSEDVFTEVEVSEDEISEEKNSEEEDSKEAEMDTSRDGASRSTWSALKGTISTVWRGMFGKK